MRSYDRHAGSLPRRVKRPGFDHLPHAEARGWRAEKRKILWFRIRCRIRRAPLGAPYALM